MANIFTRIKQCFSNQKGESNSQEIGDMAANIANNKGDVIGSGNITINQYYGQVAPTQYIPIAVEKSTDLTAEKFDLQTITNLFTYFSVYIMDDYFSQPPTDIDTRVVLISDCWSSIINASDFVIHNKETEKYITDFYKPFSQLIQYGGKYYGPSISYPNRYHFFGYKFDQFDTQEQEQAFNEILNQIKSIKPLYHSMIDHIKHNYIIDFKSLSKEFEKENF